MTEGAGRILASADFSPKSEVCEKCQDVGFIEHNAGLLTEFCDCEIGKEILVKKRAIYGIPEVADDSGTKPDNTDTGSGNTSKSKQPSKPKKKRKARKRPG